MQKAPTDQEQIHQTGSTKYAELDNFYKFTCINWDMYGVGDTSSYLFLHVYKL